MLDGPLKASQDSRWGPRVQTSVKTHCLPPRNVISNLPDIRPAPSFHIHVHAAPTILPPLLPQQNMCGKGPSPYGKMPHPNVRRDVYKGTASDCMPALFLSCQFTKSFGAQRSGFLRPRTPLPVSHSHLRAPLQVQAPHRSLPPLSRRRGRPHRSPAPWPPHQSGPPQRVTLRFPPRNVPRHRRRPRQTPRRRPPFPKPRRFLRLLLIPRRRRSCHMAFHMAPHRPPHMPCHMAPHMPSHMARRRAPRLLHRLPPLTMCHGQPRVGMQPRRRHPPPSAVLKQAPPRKPQGPSTRRRRSAPRPRSCRSRWKTGGTCMPSSRGTCASGWRPFRSGCRGSTWAHVEGPTRRNPAEAGDPVSGPAPALRRASLRALHP